MMLRDNENLELRLYRANSDTTSDVFNKLENLEKATVPDGWSAESFRSEAVKDNGFVLYIMKDAAVIALLTGYSAVGEGDITNVAVLPEFRRSGLAQQLIAEFENLLPEDTEQVFLEVRESNTPAIALYNKCGFSQIAVRKNFYSNPRENADVMMKKAEV